MPSTFTTLVTLALLALQSTHTLAHNALATPTRFCPEGQGSACAPNPGPLETGAGPYCLFDSQASLAAALPSLPVLDADQFAAGATIDVTWSSQVYHGGGSCQWSLSADEGQTWKVIYTTQGGCASAAGNKIPIPAEVPSGKFIFGVTWVPLFSGRPEFYMTCAMVQIDGKGSKAEMDSLPDMQVVFINDCKLDNNGGNYVIAYNNPGKYVSSDPTYYGSATVTPGFGLKGNCGTTSSAEPALTIQNKQQVSVSASTQQQQSVVPVTTGTTVPKLPQNAGISTGTVSATASATVSATVSATASATASVPSIQHKAVVQSTTAAAPAPAAGDAGSCAETRASCEAAWQAALATNPSSTYTCNDDFVKCSTGAAPARRALARRAPRRIV